MHNLLSPTTCNVQPRGRSKFSKAHLKAYTRHIPSAILLPPTLSPKKAYNPAMSLCFYLSTIPPAQVSFAHAPSKNKVKSLSPLSSYPYVEGIKISISSCCHIGLFRVSASGGFSITLASSPWTAKAPLPHPNVTLRLDSSMIKA